MSRPISILELRSVWGTGGGPEKTILLGAMLHDPARFRVTVCYVRDLRDQVFAIDERARKSGVDYVEIPERHSLDIGSWRRLRDFAASRQFDIVHGHDHKTDLLAWLLARRLPIVPMATSHGWSGYSWKERLIYYPADIKVIARFPAVIAVSSKIRDRLVEKGVPADRISVILNAIDPVTFQRRRSEEAAAREALGFPAGTLVIGAVGRLEQVKRFDHLIEAFARVAPHFGHARLAIAGEGTLRQALEAQAAALGVGDRCHWLGHHTDVIRLHHAFDLFVQSSESEGTPNAVLEAMAMETPVVATDVGGTRELAWPDQHALIVPRHDPAALATAITHVLAEPEAARQRAEAARQRVVDVLSFDARTRRLEDIYTRLAAPALANRSVGSEAARHA